MLLICGPSCRTILGRVDDDMLVLNHQGRIIVTHEAVIVCEKCHSVHTLGTDDPVAVSVAREELAKLQIT